MPKPLFDDATLKRHAMLTQMDPETPAAESPEGPQGLGAGPYAALFAGQGADIATTLAALSTGKFHEGNPMGAKGVLAAKAAALCLVPWLMQKLAKNGDRKAAKIMGYGVGAAGAIPAIHNVRQLTKAR